MKLVIKSNYRVVVEPKILNLFLRNKTEEEKTEEERKICEHITEQINRHVDDVDTVYTIHDTDEICSHCKLKWEVSEDDNDPEFPKGYPVCCQAAIDEHIKQLNEQNIKYTE